MGRERPWREKDIVFQESTEKGIITINENSCEKIKYGL